MMPPPLIDSHAHVHDPAFDADRAEVLARARAAGVAEIVVIGAGDDLATCERAVALAESEPGFWATVAVHPHDAARIEPGWWPRLRELASRGRVVAVGETGLDYHYDHSPRDVQRKAFGEFIALARELGKPVVCHIRDAHADARAILREAGAEAVGGVIHCFTGTPEEAAAYVDMGFYISFSGIVTFRGASADPIRAAVKRVPLDRILVETDCPYLAPHPLRGKRNEPAFVVHTAEVVAREAGIPLEELCRRTVANTRAAFSLTGNGGAGIKPPLSDRGN